MQFASFAYLLGWGPTMWTEKQNCNIRKKRCFELV